MNAHNHMSLSFLSYMRFTFTFTGPPSSAASLSQRASTARATASQRTQRTGRAPVNVLDVGVDVGVNAASQRTQRILRTGKGAAGKGPPLATSLLVRELGDSSPDERKQPWPEP